MTWKYGVRVENLVTDRLWLLQPYQSRCPSLHWAVSVLFGATLDDM